MDNNQLYTLPPHVYRELVNSLRDTAVKYAGCQQLREQISETLSSVLIPISPTSETIAAAVQACSYIDALTPEIMAGNAPQIYTAPDGVKFARWHKDGMWEEWEKQSVIPQVNSSKAELEIDMDDADPFTISRLHEIIYGKGPSAQEAKLLARFMHDVKQRMALINNG